MEADRKETILFWGKKVLKLAGWGAGIIFIIALFGNSIPTIRGYLIRGIDVYARWATAREAERKEEAYRNDTHGGKTPEETLDLFINALKKNDVELASKYYDLSVRERALQSLQEEISLEEKIQYFSRVKTGVKKCHDGQNEISGCTFRYKYIYQEETKVPIAGTNDFLLIPKGGSLDEIVDLRINHYTKVWKITQPY